jgi:hypothetical protein
MEHEQTSGNIQCFGFVLTKSRIQKQTFFVWIQPLDLITKSRKTFFFILLWFIFFLGSEYKKMYCLSNLKCLNNGFSNTAKFQ